MRVVPLTLTALLLGNVTPAPVPRPEPEPVSINVGQAITIGMRAPLLCIPPYFLTLRQQGINQAKIEDSIKSADKNWEEKLKEATSLEDKWDKERKEKEKDKKKAAADGQGQGTSSSASSTTSASLEGTVNDPRCPNAFTAYWKSQRANLESAYVKRPTASSWNAIANKRTSAATEQCKTNLLLARSKFAQQYNLYRRRHGVTGIPLEDWDVLVDTQTEAHLDKTIKEGCDYIITGVQPNPLPELAAPAPPTAPHGEQGSRQEQQPLLPLTEPSRPGGQQQQPASMPQERLPRPAGNQNAVPAPPPRGGPSTQQTPAPAGALSSSPSKMPLTPPGSPTQGSPKPGTPKKQNQSGLAPTAQESKGKGKEKVGGTEGALLRSATGLGGQGSTSASPQGAAGPASLGGVAAGDKQPAPLTKADRRKSW